MTDTAVNREEWLTRAIDPLVKIINETAVPFERDLTQTDVRVSCGWPGGKSVNKVIGQCWPTSSANGVAQAFISPVLSKPTDVLRCLLHELIHAADDCQHGHKGAFVKAFRAAGFVGKPTECVPGPALTERLHAIAEGLGEYPHSGIKPGVRVAKPQGTRMLKVECPECGYVVRTTQKWLDVCLPVCQNSDEHNGDYPLEMEQVA